MENPPTETQLIIDALSEAEEHLQYLSQRLIDLRAEKARWKALANQLSKCVDIYLDLERGNNDRQAGV
jgi:ferritin-like protein